LAVGDGGAEDAEEGASDYVEGVVPCIHDSRDSDQGRAEAGEHDDEHLPNFAFVIHDVEFSAEPEREVE
jgi:hypothetical protein